MNVEITDGFMIDEQEHLATFMIEAYLIDIHAHLRGITLTHNGTASFISLPHTSAKSAQGVEFVRFPVFSFSDKRKNDVLKHLIEEKGIQFIKAKGLGVN